jgi:hypothetical protein
MSEKINSDTIIAPFDDHDNIDNGNQILNNFWMLNDSFNGFSGQNPIDLTQELFNNANETILIYTPYLTSDVLQLCLEKRASDKIRIYILAKELDDHEKLIKWGIMRENKEIDSTFIIIDHKNKKRGIWFPGDLTKRNLSQPYILELNAPQLKDLTHFFEKNFWLATREELFFGIRRKCKALKELPIKKDQSYTSVFLFQDFTDSFQNKEIVELWIDEKTYSKFELYLSESKVIGYRISEIMKKKSDFDQFINKTVKGTVENFPFGYIQTSDSVMIFKNDLVLKLNDTQKNKINILSQMWNWEFNRSGKIKDISKPILLFDENWDKVKTISISKDVPMPLDDFDCTDIDEWFKAKTNEIRLKPKFESKIFYSRSILQTWKINPPFLPNKAKKHRLYERWERFEKEYQSILKEITDALNSELEDEDKYKKVKKKFLSKKGFWKDYQNELLSISNAKIKNNIQLFEKNINRIYELQGDFSKDLLELNENSKESKEKDKDSEDNELSEIVDVKSNKDQKSKPKIEKFDLSMAKEQLMKLIPEKELPELGILYEDSKMNYLCIKKISEIEPAKKIIEVYPHTLIVCDKSKI